MLLTLLEGWLVRAQPAALLTSTRAGSVTLRLSVAGLYVDGAVGAATATGWGEAVIRAVGSFLVVELMRQGHSPENACRLAVERVIEKNPDWREIQVGFIALNTRGEYGGYCIHPEFTFAVRREGEGSRTEAPASRI